MVKTARFQYSRKFRIIKKTISQSKIESNLKESGVKVIFTIYLLFFNAKNSSSTEKKVEITDMARFAA